MSNYTLGQLIYRIILFNETQTRERRPVDNNINFWKGFVHEFFTDNAVYKYSILVEKDLKPFVLPVRLLPRYFKSCYADNLTSSSCILDNPREFSTDTSMYFLDCPSARIVSVFADDSQVCTYGSLRVMFTNNLKIHSWEFDARKHVEYSSRPAIEEKITTIMRNLSAFVTPSNPQHEKPDIHVPNHTGAQPHIKTENDKHSMATATSRNPDGMSDCNGSSPARPNAGDGDYGNHSSDHYAPNGNSTNNNELITQVCANLQNTFAVASPVNEYGVTPQVMRCFEISEIFLSMEDLMDYCSQRNCNPKYAMALYTNPHMGGMFEPQ